MKKSFIPMLCLATTTLAESYNTHLYEAVSPQDILADDQNTRVAQDGTVVRKGTIKATIDNVRIIDNILTIEDTQERHVLLSKVIKVLEELVPSLHSLDMFEIFTPLEWLGNTKKQGRIVLASLYLSKYFDKQSPEEQAKIKYRLDQLEEQVALEVKDVMQRIIR